MSKKQRDFARKKYARLVESGQERRSFDEWMEQSWIDALIRGHVTPDENDEFRGTYSPKELDVLNKIQRYISE